MSTRATDRGRIAMDNGTGELVDILAVVDCLDDALPPEARTTNIVNREKSK